MLLLPLLSENVTWNSTQISAGRVIVAL